MTTEEMRTFGDAIVVINEAFKNCWNRKVTTISKEG